MSKHTPGPWQRTFADPKLEALARYARTCTCPPEKEVRVWTGSSPLPCPIHDGAFARWRAAQAEAEGAP